MVHESTEENPAPWDLPGTNLWGFPSGEYAGPYHAELAPMEDGLPRRWPEHGLWDE